MSQATKRRRAPEADPTQPGSGPQRTSAVREGVALAIGVLVIVGAIAWYTDAFGGAEGEPQPPEVVAPIADGDHFALVTVGTDETGAVTLGVDEAEMLTGEEARLAAIQDGVIGEGEDLPNDFYIRNPEIVYELMHFSGSSRVDVISSADPASMLRITPDDLLAIYTGKKVDNAIYGIVAGQPIAMELTVSDGVVTTASAVYLP